MEDKQRFIDLMKEAVDGLSQVEFATRCGIDAGQLSRLMRGRYTYTPKPETLERIAEASDGRVSFVAFMNACGHDMAGYEEKKQEKKKNQPDCFTARDNVREIKESFERLYGKRVRTLDELISLVYPLKRCKVTLSEERACEESIDNNAEDYVFLTAKEALTEKDAQYIMLLTYNHTAGGAIILSQCLTDGEHLLLTEHLEEVLQTGLDALDQDEIMAVDKFYLLQSRDELTESDKARLRDGIRKLVGKKNEKYISAIQGIGFKPEVLEFEDEDDNHVRKFLKAHIGSLSKPYQRDIEKYLKSDDVLPCGDYVVCSTTGCGGWGAYISNIISKETGVPVSYWTQEDGWDDFLFDGNPDVILIDESVYRDKGENWALDIMEPYARELGIKVIGTQYFQIVFDKEQGVSRFLSSKEENV